MADNEQLHFSRGDVISRRYEIEEHLGSGMLGATYLARHIHTGKRLAIKILRPKLIENPLDRKRFEEAFDKARGLRVEGVVRLGEVGEHNGLVYYTQEYFESISLRALMDRYHEEQKSFTLQEACQIALKILDALDHLHDAGIIHRNVKPENVLVHERRTGPGGKNIIRTVKITDPGMAVLANSTIFAESYVNRSEARYLAPELGGFQDNATPRADVYSVGVILYELLVGQPPRGTYLSPTQLRGDLPEHIDDVVEIALAPSPDDRYPSARDMYNDIQRSFSGDVYEDRRSTSFKSILIAVGVAVAVIAAYAVYISIKGTPDPRQELIAKDQRIRTQVQAMSQPPSEDFLKKMVAKHPEMLYVPGGPFVRGRLHAEPLSIASQAEPLAEVAKVEAFYIDRFEFPNRLKDKDGKPVRPVAKVTWEEADKTCRKLGKRLCTELEWEKACKGPANWIYSYGDEYKPEICGGDVDEPYVIGERESCVSGYGVADLSGGLREWTSTVAGSKGNRRVVKGGLRGNPKRGTRCAFRVDEAATYADATLSFRCCLDAPPAEEPPAAPEEAPAE